MNLSKMGFASIVASGLLACGQQVTPAPQAAPQQQIPVQQPMVLQQAAPVVVQQPPIVVQQAPQSRRTAYVYDPPSNVRTSATGPILCVISQPTTINIYGYGGTTYDGARKVTWYQTDACGQMGVIAYSQIR